MPCFVCDQLWYNSSLRQIPSNAHSLLQQEFSLGENFDIKIAKDCHSCYNSLRKSHILYLSVTCKKPDHLPPLNAISEQFVSPRIPFLQICHLRHCCRQYAT